MFASDMKILTLSNGTTTPVAAKHQQQHPHEHRYQGDYDMHHSHQQQQQQPSHQQLAYSSKSRQVSPKNTPGSAAGGGMGHATKYSNSNSIYQQQQQYSHSKCNNNNNNHTSNLNAGNKHYKKQHNNYNNNNSYNRRKHQQQQQQQHYQYQHYQHHQQQQHSQQQQQQMQHEQQQLNSLNNNNNNTYVKNQNFVVDMLMSASNQVYSSNNNNSNINNNNNNISNNNNNISNNNNNHIKPSCHNSCNDLTAFSSSASSTSTASSLCSTLTPTSTLLLLSSGVGKHQNNSQPAGELKPPQQQQQQQQRSHELVISGAINVSSDSNNNNNNNNAPDEAVDPSKDSRTHNNNNTSTLNNNNINVVNNNNNNNCSNNNNKACTSCSKQESATQSMAATVTTTATATAPASRTPSSIISATTTTTTNDDVTSPSLQTSVSGTATYSNQRKKNYYRPHRYGGGHHYSQGNNSQQQQQQSSQQASQPKQQNFKNSTFGKQNRQTPPLSPQTGTSQQGSISCSSSTATEATTATNSVTTANKSITAAPSAVVERCGTPPAPEADAATKCGTCNTAVTVNVGEIKKASVATSTVPPTLLASQSKAAATKPPEAAPRTSSTAANTPSAQPVPQEAASCAPEPSDVPCPPAQPMPTENPPPPMTPPPPPHSPNLHHPPRSPRSGSSSGPGSPNSYSLDFLHQVGVQMTGGANLMAFKSSMAMRGMLHGASFGASGTPGSGAIGCSPLYNFPSIVSGVHAPRGQRFMGGGHAPGQGHYGGAEPQQPYHHQQQHHHHHHQPSQLTIASFLQKDLFGEAHSSGGGGGNQSYYASRYHGNRYGGGQGAGGSGGHYGSIPSSTYYHSHYGGGGGGNQHRYSSGYSNGGHAEGGGVSSSRLHVDTGHGGPGRHQNQGYAAGRGQQSAYNNNYGSHSAETKQNGSAGGINQPSRSSSCSSTSSISSNSSKTNAFQRRGKNGGGGGASQPIETVSHKGGPHRSGQGGYHGGSYHRQHGGSAYQYGGPGHHQQQGQGNTGHNQNLYNLTYVTTEAQSSPQPSGRTERASRPDANDATAAMLLNLKTFNLAAQYQQHAPQQPQHPAQPSFMHAAKIPPLMANASGSATLVPPLPARNILCCSQLDEAATTAAAVASGESLVKAASGEFEGETQGGAVNAMAVSALERQQQQYQQKQYLQQQQQQQVGRPTSSSSCSLDNLYGGYPPLGATPSYARTYTSSESGSSSGKPAQQQQPQQKQPEMTAQYPYPNDVMSLFNLHNASASNNSGNAKNYNHNGNNRKTYNEEEAAARDTQAQQQQQPQQQPSQQQQPYQQQQQQQPNGMLPSYPCFLPPKVDTATSSTSANSVPHCFFGGDNNNNHSYWTPSAIQHMNYIYMSRNAKYEHMAPRSASNCSSCSPRSTEGDEILSVTSQTGLLPTPQAGDHQRLHGGDMVDVTSKPPSENGLPLDNCSSGRSEMSLASVHKVQSLTEFPPLPILFGPEDPRSALMDTAAYLNNTPPDRFIARARCIEMREPPAALLANCKWDNLSQSIWQKVVKAQQTVETYVQKMRLWRYLFVVVKSTYPRYGLYMVGSTLTGFGAETSDLDMCLVSRAGTIVEQRLESLYHLTLLRDCLTKTGDFEKFNLIEAKVPILRFKDRIHKMEVDLNYNNSVGIKNSHLMFCYSKLDWRLRPLVLITKLWAQFHNINNAKNMTISSYSLALMVIHYLQFAVTPAVLPCLHELHPDKFPMLRSHDFGTVDFNDDFSIYSSKNCQTLGELFLGFLEYYSCFDYSQFAISVRTGGLLPINSCRIAKSPKNDPHQWKELCIEEPFDQSNTARSVYDSETFERVKAVFVASWRTLSESLDLNAVFSPIVIHPSKQLPMLSTSVGNVQGRGFGPKFDSNNKLMSRMGNMVRGSTRATYQSQADRNLERSKLERHSSAESLMAAAAAAAEPPTPDSEADSQPECESRRTICSQQDQQMQTHKPEPPHQPQQQQSASAPQLVDKETQFRLEYLQWGTTGSQQQDQQIQTQPVQVASARCLVPPPKEPLRLQPQNVANDGGK